MNLIRNLLDSAITIKLLGLIKFVLNIELIMSMQMVTMR